MKHFNHDHKFEIGDKVRCFAPAGWGGNQGDLIDRVTYSGDGLDKYGLPKHGTLYCVRGYDDTCDIPSVYLVGISGGIRQDGSEMSFGEAGFLSSNDYARAIRSIT